jgi:hypothetical protein
MWIRAFISSVILALVIVDVYCQAPGLKLNPYKKGNFKLGGLEQPIVIKETSEAPEKFSIRDLIRKSESNFKAAFSHRVTDAAVYNLALDNMPCLVPNQGVNTPMPIAGRVYISSDPMPNPFLGRGRRKSSK